MFTKLIYMKLLLVLLIALNSEFAFSKKERGSICDPREPTITLSNAVDIAMEQVAKIQNLDELFIDTAQLNCENGKAEWLIGFRRKEYESGHLVVSIDMKKNINTQIIKDG